MKFEVIVKCDCVSLRPIMLQNLFKIDEDEKKKFFQLKNLTYSIRSVFYFTLA